MRRCNVSHVVVSVKDVAAAASVSVGTVSNVLNRPEKVTPATVERVLRAIDELGFVRNDAARQLRAGRSRSIGLVTLDVANPFFAEIARGAEDRAALAGMAVLLGNSGGSAARERVYLELFREQRVNGVLITPAAADVGPLRRLRDSGIPVVLVDHDLSDETFGSVSVDDVEGGYLAASHLLEAGRRHIAFVGGPPWVRQVADRLEGARRAVAAAPDATFEVLETSELTVLQGREVGERILARPVAERPDALFAANDVLAVGLLQALGIMVGAAIPDDIALIGYDDIDFASATVVPLSSIRQPARLIGSTAVEILLDQLATPGAEPERNVRFRPQLVVRASTVR